MIKKIKTFIDNFFKSTSVYEAISPLIGFGRLTNITPFNYHIESRKPKTVLLKKKILLNLMFLSFYLVCVYCVMMEGMFFSNPENNITKVFAFSEKAEFYLGFFVIHCIIVNRFRKIDNWAINIKYLLSIDILFEKLGLWRDYKRLKKDILLSVMFQLVYCMIYVAFTIYTMIPYFNEVKNFALAFAKYGTTFHILATRFIISSYTHLVFFNLRSLNEEISKIKNMKVNFVKDSNNGKILTRNCFIIKKLDLIFKIFSEICESNCVLNDSYSITMFAIISWSFFSTLLYSFYVMMSLIKLYDGNEMHWQMLLLALVQCLVNGFNFFWMIEACDKCENEVIIKYIHVLFGRSCKWIFLVLFKVFRI